jgi:hypothetical protein
MIFHLMVFEKYYIGGHWWPWAPLVSESTASIEWFDGVEPHPLASALQLNRDPRRRPSVAAVRLDPFFLLP